MELLNFILFFSLALTAITWISPEKWRLWIVMIGTLIFLLIKAPISLGILTITTATSYFVFKFQNLSTLTATLFVIVQNVLLFAIYKVGISPLMISPMDQLIPLGLSYYSFRQIHYAIEKYKGQLSPHNFGDYASYLFFLPTILIGPINRFQPFLRNTYRRRWNPALFSEGLERIVYGYAKVVVIGNFLVSDKMNVLINLIEHQDGWLYHYLQLFKYTLNTYFQFAGYSDVAIGLALLLGYRVMENFNYPFFAENINEFWNRWHISLSSWCKDYVFTPVASITRKPILGILLTMLAIGLWHDISLKYVIWAFYHGAGIAIWHLYNKSSKSFLLSKVTGYNIIGAMVTFHFVMYSFVIIQHESWKDIWSSYKILFGI